MNPLPLFIWMNERHRIYLRRAAGEPAPWTYDLVLREYKFTNVYRELDRFTVWLRRNVRSPFADHPDLWLMIALARYVGVPESLAPIMTADVWRPGQPDFGAIVEHLESRRAAGEQVETGAYMIRAESNPAAAWYSWSKQRYIVEVVVGGMWRNRGELLPHLRQSIEAATDALALQYGCGGFMAYEIATDLRWCPGWLTHAPDIMTFANPGPGAKRGLNRLHGRPLKNGRAAWLSEMRALLDMSPLYLAEWMPALEMRDVEHSLCEMDKYIRAATGEGRPRSKFTPWTS